MGETTNLTWAMIIFEIANLEGEDIWWTSMVENLGCTTSWKQRCRWTPVLQNIVFLMEEIQEKTQMIWSISNDIQFFCTIFTLQGFMIHLNLLDRFLPSAIPQNWIVLLWWRLLCVCTVMCNMRYQCMKHSRYVYFNVLQRMGLKKNMLATKTHFW